MASDQSLSSMNLQFLACSGATTEDLWASGATGQGLKGPSRTEPQQLLDTGDLANARIVTVSIGGDDLNFADILAHCVSRVVLRIDQASCSATSKDHWISQLKAHIDALGPILFKTYKMIENETSPGTALYVVGYPDIFPAKPTTGCVPKSLISVAGMRYLSSFQSRLAGVVEAATSRANAHYVDPNSPNGPNTFIGHSLCANDPYVRGVVKTNRQYSSHPNALGQQKLAAAVEDAIRATTVSSRTPIWSNVDSNIGPLSVTCPTTSFCAANDTQGDVVTYDGTSWSAPRYVDTSGGYMNSVSCATSSKSKFCAGVDNQGYVVTFNGSSWSQPNLIDPNGDGLMRVSCANVTFCVAVDANGSALMFNGTSWSLQSNIDPSAGLLWAVSCPTSTFCAALDLAGNVVMYDGSSWSPPVNVDPTGGIQGGTISCPTSSFCAVSDSVGDVATFNGTSWSQPSLIDANRLTSISCTSASFCTAVDIAGNVLTYNGSLWSQPTALTPVGVLWAVGCPTQTYCTAVGDNGIFTYR
jgi:hypothetical protein